MDASVQRIQPEPVIAGPRGSSRHAGRKQREGESRRESEPHFLLDPRPAHGTGAHLEPHSPKGEGLGEKLDVIA